MSSTRHEREAQLRQHLEAGLLHLHYRFARPIKYGRADVYLVFLHQRCSLPTEAILIRVKWKPSPVMDVNFVGATVPIEVVREKGIERLGEDRRASIINLFLFQFDHLSRDPLEVLPQLIPIDDGNLHTVAMHLVDEIAETHEQVWLTLANRLRAR